MRGVCICICVLAQSLTVWPKPQQQTASGLELAIADGFDFKVMGSDSGYLRDAFNRYQGIMFNAKRRLPVTATMSSSETAHVPIENKTHEIPASSVVGCDVNVQTDDLSLDLETDESYSLNILAPRIQITSKTVYGVSFTRPPYKIGIMPKLTIAHRRCELWNH
jgi:hypothetical protein